MSNLGPTDLQEEAASGSPFTEAGPTLVRLGYSAIPISPADKMPGRLTGGEWRAMTGWSRYCGVLPGAFELALWSKWPEANVGVACGRGILAFDIDRDDLVAPIKAVLPPCVVAKRGRKGETLFFRGDTDAIRSRGFKIDKKGVLDLIADGKQTVVPPSIHPDTQAPYAWTTPRTLLDTPPGDLTEVTVDHVEAVIEVLRAHGYEAPETFSPPIIDGFEPSSGDDTSGWYRRLNEDALANLHAWVPRLGLSRLVHSGDGYRSVAEWRPSSSGKPVGKRRLLLSIDPKGIVDYGDGDKGYTALNLVIAAFEFGPNDLDKATVWLGEAIGYDFAPKMVLNRNRKKLTPQEEAARAYQRAQEGGDAPAAPVAADAPAPAVLSDADGLAEAVDAAANVVAFPEPDDTPPGLTHEQELSALVEGVPGLVGDLVEWMRVTCETPNPILSFAAALAFVGTLAGRNYAAPGRGARTNVYTIGLAPSGFGKDHARQCIKHIVDKGGLGRFLGGSKIMSGSALRKRIEANPSTLYMIDEFGGFMGEINNKKMPHSYQIRDHLLEYFGSASTFFQGADYAGEQAVKCFNPNVCLYGTSTPTDFWGSCRSLSVADGLLARMLIFSVGSDLPPEVEPTAVETNPPAKLVKACQHLTKSKVGGNLNNVLSDGSTTCTALAVTWADAAAKDYYFAMKAEFRRLGFDKGEDEGSLWNRTTEHAVKIALILSVGVDPDVPVIRKEMLVLARRIVELCTLMTIDQIAGRLADNDRQREHVDVKRWIVEAGADGISRTTISKRVNGRFDRRRLDDILKSLEEDSREIVAVVTKPTVGAGRPGNRYFATSALAARTAATR